MKYFNILFLAVCFTLTATVATAQDANFMNYQAVAHNAAGEVMANEDISLRISIVKGSPEGTASFVETHYATTNQFGLFNLQIGRGSAEKGSFESMQWNADRFFLKIEMDINGWQTLGISELATVPYAMAATWATEAAHAKTSDHALIADSVRNMPEGKEITTFGLIDHDHKADILSKPNQPGDIWIADDVAGSVYFNDGNHWYLVAATVACTEAPAGVSSGTGAANVSGTTFTLSGSALQTGESGQWVILSGNDGSFSNPASNNATFTGAAGESYTLKWIVSNACGNTHGNEITISFLDECPDYVIGTNSYSTAIVGTQCWMTQNINETGAGKWDGTVDYDDDGIAEGVRYYTWNEAQTFCTNGWHLPTVSDATVLRNHYIANGGSAFNSDGLNASAAGWKEMIYNPGYGLHGVGTNSYYWLQNQQDDNFAYYLHAHTTYEVSTPGGSNSLYKGYGALVLDFGQN